MTVAKSMALLFASIILLQNVNLYNAGECPIDNCRHCTSLDECSVCDASRFGRKCEHKCRADFSTCSLCSDSFLIALKSESACFGCKEHEHFSDGECRSCPKTCVSCTNLERCSSCKAGYYGAVCQNICPKNCMKCSSLDLCMVCKENWTGSTCQCSQSCVKDGRELEWCTINGTCLKGCIDGKQGRMCTFDCPKTESCRKCDQYNGHCLKCSYGLYGSNYCDQKCGQCKPNDNGDVECSTETGECNSACLDGFFDRRCDTKCAKCLPDDTGVIQCDIDTGKCRNGCIGGYHGRSCDKKCGHCLPDMEGVIKCDIDTGNCSTTCIGGYYGQSCDQECNWNCLKSMTNSDICDKETGTCTFGCVSGWYGDVCETACSNACYNKSCNQISGQCDHGCILGWYGDKCNRTCNGQCVDKSCSQLSGHCNFECPNGFYGDTCERICVGRCRDGICDKQTSSCLIGCEIGYEGMFCNETMEADFGLAVIGIISGFAGVLTLSAGLMMTWLAVRFAVRTKRCKGVNAASKRNTEPVYSEVCENTFENILETQFSGENIGIEGTNSQLGNTEECGSRASAGDIYDVIADRKSNCYTSLTTVLVNTQENVQSQLVNAFDIEIKPVDSDRNCEVPVPVLHNTSVLSESTSTWYHEIQGAKPCTESTFVNARTLHENNTVPDVSETRVSKNTAFPYTKGKCDSRAVCTSGHILTRPVMKSFRKDQHLRVKKQTETIIFKETDSSNYLHPVI